jgi:alcohol dehydrogenase (cytochrome c)
VRQRYWICLLLVLGAGARAAEMTPHAEAAAPLPTASEWPSYNGSLAGTRFSTLGDINRDTVGGLGEVCRIHVAEPGPFHTGPILTNNLMYLTTSHATMALNPANCDIVWKSLYTPEGPEPWTSNRGLAHWQGKLVRGTPDARLVAYDANTGKELWKTVVGDGGAGELLDAAPVAWNGLIFMGVSGGDFGIRGRMLAFDAGTGRIAWQFNLIPQPGEPGIETWDSDSYQHGGGGTWTSFALDPDSGEVFVPVANPAPSFDGSTRRGANLYTGSLVVLDALSGKLRWYYQVRPHDEHDYGVTAPPLLYTLRDGRKVVGLGTKDGVVYVIDRASHKLLFKTPVVRIKNHDVAATPAGIEICPGVLGGVEWNSPAFDTPHSALVVGANDWCTRIKSAPQEFERGRLFTKGTVEMLGHQTGTITSLDANTGKIRWQQRTPNGVVAAILPTAGGLVFAGDLDGTLYALNSDDGKILKTISTGGALAGGIVTYTVAGKQYLAVTSGNISRSTFGAVGTPSIVIYSLGASAPASGADGAHSYSQLCASCHGTHGEGSQGPALQGIATRQSLQRTIELIKKPASDKMPMLYPGTLSEGDVESVAAYIRSFQ